MLLKSEKLKSNKPIVWTISGSDSCGAAGVQADLKSFSDFSVHGCSVIAAVTAQNSEQVVSLNAVDAQVIRDQIKSLSESFYPQVIKLGMLASADVVNQVCDFLEKNPEIYVVCDPVIQSSSGAALLDEEGFHVFKNRLLALVDLLLPNIPELESLTGETIKQVSQISQAADLLLDQGVAAVLVKGGHTENFVDSNKTEITDWFFSKSGERLVTAPKVFSLTNTRHDHGARGTGCRLASSIAAILAHGYALEDACVMANSYLNSLIGDAYKVSKNTSEKSSYLLSQVESFSSEYLPSVSCQNVVDFNSSFPESKDLGLYPVVDDVRWLEKLLPLGIKTIQLRLKDLSLEEVEKQIIRAVELQDKFQIKFFVNDYWQLAIKHGAYGVHLGQEDLFDADVHAIHAAGLHLGLSTHGWWELARARSFHPSYIAIGPIYPTTTKQMPFKQQGLERLKNWVDCLSGEYEVVAIGGINQARMKDVLSTGVDSIALVSAITQAKNPQLAAEDLMETFVSSDRVNNDAKN